jgi:outer membrane protein OmpA-like peptidoglycan-associated protein
MRNDHLPLEDPAETQTLQSAGPAAPSRNNLPPTVVLALVIIALLGGLIAMAVKNKIFNSSPVDERLLALQSDIDARRSELNRQRAKIGLSPFEGSSEPIEAIAGRLKKEADSLVALSTRFQEMLAEKDTELTAKSEEILRSEKLRQSLYAENNRLQSELNRALVGGSDADRLRLDLAELKAQRDALTADLALMKQKLLTASAGVSSDDFADLKRRYDEVLRAKEFFEGRVKELEGDLTKSKLFASSEDELQPAAVSLFRSLRQLEGRPDSDLTTSYSGLGVDLGANVLSTLTFATGASTLTTADQDTIGNLAAGIPDGDLLFVVGYASKTGNVDSNQTLSSDRATAVAQQYAGLKRPGQLVQAVYLGQTDRFSSRIPERNQLVEIWRIRKK